MALRLKRTLSTSLLFHAHERTVTLALLEVQDFFATFTMQNDKILKHFHRWKARCSTLMYEVRVYGVSIDEISGKTVALRIEEPDSVGIVRGELAETRH